MAIERNWWKTKWWETRWGKTTGWGKTKRRGTTHGRKADGWPPGTVPNRRHPSWETKTKGDTRDTRRGSSRRPDQRHPSWGPDHSLTVWRKNSKTASPSDPKSSWCRSTSWLHHPNPSHRSRTGRACAWRDASLQTTWQHGFFWEVHKKTNNTLKRTNNINNHQSIFCSSRLLSCRLFADMT